MGLTFCVFMLRLFSGFYYVIILLKTKYMAIDWTNIYKKYKGLWVALSDDEETVLAFGETAGDALENAKSKGCKNPILSKMPEKLITYVGFGI